MGGDSGGKENQELSKDEVNDKTLNQQFSEINFKDKKDVSPELPPMIGSK